MNDTKADAVLIGGGHNGLVAATRLAHSGMRVVVLEANEQPGGAARGYEIHPGFRLPALAHMLPAFDRRAIRELKLGRYGLGTPINEATTVSLLPDGGSVVLHPDADTTAAGLREHSASDAEAWPDFQRRLRAHTDALRPLLASEAPRLDFADRRNLLTLGRLGWSIRRRGRQQMRDLLQVITMNVADLLEDHFETDALMGALALDAVLGTDHGPRSPNTVFTLLHRLAGHMSPRARSAAANGGRPRRPVEALLEAARAAGVEIRTGVAVQSIRVEAGVTRGVELADGSAIDSPVVVSNADPVTTCSELVDADHLDADFRREIRAIRTKGTTGKVGFALDRLPHLPQPASGGPLRWVIAPSIGYVERAFDHVKYGEAVPEPALEITIPSLDDPECAPAGQHVMSVNVAYAPYSESLDPDEMGQTITAMIERHAPGFAQTVLAREAWGPREIEARFGMRGGHWHHGDIALDQFFMVRPVPGFAQYRAPIEGLYLCGAGTHPGGGVTGTNGINAARAVLRDRRNGRRAA
ncbi:phytoene desaturase family protein [Halofilum ochraceum]|uniref:phytoene desaturase family protein n=1 Tax=Halofilum ochraceum TaxID=1611323 RepID=UPI0008DB0676|nr:NAD(P)/FAD-dependent oxidoreductase [Halofilum ochraceum]